MRRPNTKERFSVALLLGFFAACGEDAEPAADAGVIADTADTLESWSDTASPPDTLAGASSCGAALSCAVTLLCPDEACVDACSADLAGTEEARFDALFQCMQTFCGAFPTPACYLDASAACQSERHACDGGGCIAQCDGKVCGSDNCGGSCGGCPDTQFCEGGQCVPGAQDGCADIYACARACGDQSCVFLCLEEGDPVARALFEPLLDCVVDACGVTPTADCIEAALDGVCIVDAARCGVSANCAPEGPPTCCGDDVCSAQCGTPTRVETCAHGCDGGTCRTSAACQPDCAGKTCGSDGCGGSCGTCQGAETCNGTTQTCGCAPEASKGCCGDAVCWFDACGNQGAVIATCQPGGPGKEAFCHDGMCCSATAYCHASGDLWIDLATCAEPGGLSGTFAEPRAVEDCGPTGCSTVNGVARCGCTPQCAGKACGDNGCGGVCGTCAGGTCVGGQCQCAASCAGTCASDGCGGSCAAVCPANSSCSDAGTTCVCNPGFVPNLASTACVALGAACDPTNPSLSIGYCTSSATWVRCDPVVGLVAVDCPSAFGTSCFALASGDPEGACACGALTEQGACLDHRGYDGVDSKFVCVGGLVSVGDSCRQYANGRCGALVSSSGSGSTCLCGPCSQPLAGLGCQAACAPAECWQSSNGYLHQCQ